MKEPKRIYPPGTMFEIQISLYDIRKARLASLNDMARSGEPVHKVYHHKRKDCIWVVFEGENEACFIDIDCIKKVIYPTKASKILFGANNEVKKI